MENVIYRTPETLQILTKQNRKTFRQLAADLHKLKSDHLDQMVHALHEKAFSGFSCLDCANCCKTLGPRLSSSDIERMARFLKIKLTDFYSLYIIADEDGDMVFAGHPCPFLLPDNQCRVYPQRPKACREYPHTDRKNFRQILDLSLKNCETCPVVFDIFTEIKDNR
jgi:uncharacterized protein